MQGKRYFLLFVDDYTCMMRVYFFEWKSQAFTYFLQFKALTEKESGHNLKILRSDHGIEFNWNEFDNFYKKESIKRELTIRKTPQQNGVAERKNRIIVEMAHIMLQSNDLPK